jgi:hypothetical protein
MIPYTIHPNPKASAPDGQPSYHPRIDGRDKVAGLADVQRAMRRGNSPLAPYLPATLLALQDAILSLLADGNSIRLPGLGTFVPQLAGEVRADDQGTTEPDARRYPRLRNVHIANITYRVDAQLLQAASRLPAEPSSALHLPHVSLETLEENLQRHFATHATLTRRQLIRDLYADTISQYQANRILHHLVEDGRLERVGQGCKVRYRLLGGNASSDSRDSRISEHGS